MERHKYDPITPEDKKERRRFESLSQEDKESYINAKHEKALMENYLSFIELIESSGDEKIRERFKLALNIAEKVKREGGFALVVGGFVRDAVLQKLGHEVSPKDIDIEVYGLEFEKLKKVLQNFGEIDVVGLSFGVVKLGGIDISIPRKDSKTGKGHKGFAIRGDPNMIAKDAALRRDFTFNALALNPLTGEILDYYNGVQDLRDKIIRATDHKLFQDDPLRVLRAAQFSGRFGFKIEEETAKLCRKMDIKELPKERIGEEWVKLLLKSPGPSIGLEALKELEVIDKLHPELKLLFDTKQDREWHPEGNVWIHTGMVVDAMAKIIREEDIEEERALTLLLAAVCHDLGKPLTTVREENGRITSKGHTEAGVEPTKSFLKSINAPFDAIDRVVPLVKEHLFPTTYRELTDKAVKRLAIRLYPSTIQDLVYLAKADQKGRGMAQKQEEFGEIESLLKKAKELSLEQSKPKPIIMGRDLIELGFQEGKFIGQVLKEIDERYLDGEIKTFEQAQSYALDRLKPAV